MTKFARRAAAVEAAECTHSPPVTRTAGFGSARDARSQRVAFVFVWDSVSALMTPAGKLLERLPPKRSICWYRAREFCFSRLIVCSSLEVGFAGLIAPGSLSAKDYPPSAAEERAPCLITLDSR